eukprot:4650045-Prymnesium_polylepis.2
MDLQLGIHLNHCLLADARALPRIRGVDRRERIARLWQHSAQHIEQLVQICCRSVTDCELRRQRQLSAKVHHRFEHTDAHLSPPLTRWRSLRLGRRLRSRRVCVSGEYGRDIAEAVLFARDTARAVCPSHFDKPFAVTLRQFNANPRCSEDTVGVPAQRGSSAQPTLPMSSSQLIATSRSASERGCSPSPRSSARQC